MKREIKIPLGIIVLIAIIVIVVVLTLNKKSTNKILGYDDYYKLTYSSSYSSPGVLGEGKYYELVDNETRLNEILNKTNGEDINNIFNANFFEKNQLLVIQGGIDSEINTLKISSTNVDIIIYSGSPLTSLDQIWDRDLYIIPINKSIEFNNIKITNTTYSDRIY